MLGYFEEAENGTLHQAYCVKARNIFSYTRTSGLSNELSIFFNFFSSHFKDKLKTQETIAKQITLKCIGKNILCVQDSYDEKSHAVLTAHVLIGKWSF